MKRGFSLRVGAILIAAVLFASVSLASAPARAANIAGEPTVVRVGVYESNGFVALDDHGEMSGYGADFMERLAEYANIRYEYVRLTWSECLEGLLTGAIDIVTDARQTAERDTLYDFSDQCIGQIQAAIFVSRDTDIYFNDYDAMRELRVGFEKDSINKTLYEEFAAQHGYTALTQEYHSASELRKALDSGEIDAFGDNANVYTDDLKVISVYNTKPNYIMAPKGSEIMKRLNLAIEEMYTKNPDMIAAQYDYLAAQQIYRDLLLTREEAEYVEQHPVLRVAAYTDRKPASWYDEESGEFKGIAIELMDKLSGLTGLRFEYVPVDGRYSTEGMLEQDNIDLVMPLVSEEYYNGNVPVSITDPLYSLTVAIILKDGGKLENGEKLTVATAKSNEGIREMLAAYFSNIEFKSYDTTQECIDALRAGETDAYGNAMYELEYTLRSPRNRDLRIAYSYNCPIDYCIAMRQDAPVEMLEILNDGIALISQDEVDRIVRYYSTFLQYDASFADKLYENRYFLTVMGGLLTAILAGWLVYYKTQKRTVREIAVKRGQSRNPCDLGFRL